MRVSTPVPGLLSTRSLIRVYVVAVAVGLPVLVAMYLAFPGARETLMWENGVVESIQLAFYLIAAAAALLTWRRRSTESQVPLAWVVPALALLATLEELAWGQNIFGWQNPRVHGEKLSAFGDLPGVIVALLGASALPLGIVLALAVAAVMLIAVYRAREILARGFILFLVHPPLRFVLLWAALVLVAVVVDMGALDLPYELFGRAGVLGAHGAVEETLELYAALALMFAGLALLGAARGAGTRAAVSGPRLVAIPRRPPAN